MNWHDLLQRLYWVPMAQCGGGALLVFVLLWWRKHREPSSWALVATGAAWMACHLSVNLFSYLIPPKQPVDWLLPGSTELTLTALLASWKRWPGAAVLIFTAASLVAATWLALRQMPFLMERGETPVERQIYTAAGLAAVLLIFFAAEWLAREVTPAALLAGLAVFALLTSLSLWRMISPRDTITRPLAAAALCGGAALAAFFRPGAARAAPGMGGWLAGGIVVLFTFGGLSRVTDVPLRPMAAAAASLPATAVVLFLYRRIFGAGQSLAFLAAMLLCGTAVFSWSGRDEEKAAASTPASTGADDTGAYD